MIKQIGFAYQSAALAAEIQRNLCNVDLRNLW